MYAALTHLIRVSYNEAYMMSFQGKKRCPHYTLEDKGDIFFLSREKQGGIDNHGRGVGDNWRVSPAAPALAGAACQRLPGRTQAVWHASSHQNPAFGPGK